MFCGCIAKHCWTWARYHPHTARDPGTDLQPKHMMEWVGSLESICSRHYTCVIIVRIKTYVQLSLDSRQVHGVLHNLKVVLQQHNDNLLKVSCNKTTSCELCTNQLKKTQNTKNTRTRSGMLSFTHSSMTSCKWIYPHTCYINSAVTTNTSRSSLPVPLPKDILNLVKMHL